MALVPLAEARTHVLDRVRTLAATSVPLADALGLVLAEPVRADEAVPPFDNTAMDGFAVRAADTAAATEADPVTLRVVATLHAGGATDVAVGPGEAVRIMTGAPMPPGADAVVVVERTAPSSLPIGEGVDVSLAVEPGTHVRRFGDDVARGDEVLAAGAELTPAAIGVLASIGVGEVTVVPRPRVGVVSTGDELVQGDAALLPGQIRDSNRPMLLATVAAAGFTPVDLGHAPDDLDAITEAFRRGGERCDAVLSSGGVSMGDADLVKMALDELGEFRWMQIAIKPAKPFAFGLVPRGGHADDALPVFGLPGNPVSSAVSFALLAAPALRRMAGRAVVDPPTVLALVDAPLTRRPDGKVHYARVVCRYQTDDGRYHVSSAGGQGSHQLAGLAAADGLAVLPDGPTVEPGRTVEVLLLG